MAVRLERVTVRYPGSPRPAVESVTLNLEPGECVALTGPNGGGKTTIIRVASGLVPRVIPARVEGTVRVDGLDPSRERVSGILQVLVQDPKTQVIGPTVLLEAAMGPLFAGLPRGEVLSRAYTSLRLLGIEGLAGRSTSSLSGGELLKAGIAGVLSPRPRYLLLDEPTSMLDAESRETVYRLIGKLPREGRGVLLATHDPELAGVCDRAYTVKGRLEPGIYARTPRPPRPPEPGDEWAVRVEEASYSYPGRPSVLRGVSIEAPRGGLTVLAGPNGSGKTTLLLLVAGLLKPETGRVLVRGRVALLPQDPLLVFSRPTLRDEAPRPPAWAESIADKPVLALSGGELRLAALALVASSGAQVLLLDEPTSGLDPENRELVANVIAGLARSGASLLVATHDPLLERAATRLYRLEGGRAWLEYSAY